MSTAAKCVDGGVEKVVPTEAIKPSIEELAAQLFYLLGDAADNNHDEDILKLVSEDPELLLKKDASRQTPLGQAIISDNKAAVKTLLV